MAQEVDLATAVATELAKQVPIKDVYKEGLSPAVVQTGGALGDFVKTLRLALAPLQFTAALQDRYVKFLDRSVRGIPEEHRAIPAAQIVGPVLEAIKYEPEDTIISEMFNELLAKAFDKRRAAEAHPAYAPLIRQLSIDEAKILHMINAKLLQGGHFNFHFQDSYDGNTNRFYGRKITLDELPKDDLAAPETLPAAIEHLDKLGLASVMQYKNQQPIFTGNVQTGSASFARYQLTEFGTAFMRAASKN